MSPLEVPYGKMLWEKLIRKNDQIFMTLNGHYHGAARLAKTNDFGNPVEEMVVDYQMAYQGRQRPDAPVRIRPDPQRDQGSVLLALGAAKPKETLNAFDQAVLTAPNEQFTIKMDFAQRFSGFNKTFKPGAAARSSLVEQARALILANYTDPATIVQKPAVDSEDYQGRQHAGALALLRRRGRAAREGGRDRGRRDGREPDPPRA